MRKALMGLILAATVMTPIAAEAQRGHRDGGDRGESRAARIEQRNEARQANNDAPAPQAQPQPQPQQQVVQRQRGGDGGGNRNNWRGNDNNNNNNNQGSRGGSNRGAGGGVGDRRRNDNNDQNNQGNRGGWNRGDRGGDGGDRRGRDNQPSIYPQTWQGNPNDPRLRNYERLERRNQERYGRGGDRDRDGRTWRGDRDGRNDRSERRRNWRNDWNHGWRNDGRYNWSHWRQRNRNRFHLSPYYSPYRDYGYSRFSIGLFLEPLFYGQRYWIGDPWQYRLPPAPPGTQWVRYYDDVILVDVYSGEIIDVIYDFFW
jgi:hypothetical protein